MSGGVVCPGVVRPGCGAVLLLLGTSVPGGGGSADGRIRVCAKGLLNCIYPDVCGFQVLGGKL
jgi:hypothetical protein